MLFPVQTAKVDDLKDQFYFITDSDPTYRTKTVLAEECMFLRKKPLLDHRLPRGGWGNAILLKGKQHA